MDNALGDFLRARRELVTPQEAGLLFAVGRNRRVSGLRREEVAILAGISGEYYTRLERGRDRNPSHQVICALSEVLQLDRESALYLASLAGPKAARYTSEMSDHVPHGVDVVLRTINVPALVLNQYSDVLAANALAQQLAPHFAPGVNRLRWLFTDPAAQDHDPHWDSSTAAGIAHLRAQAGTDPDDERLHGLIGELSLRSARFRQLWARHEVHTTSGGDIVVNNPTFGHIRLVVEKFMHAGDNRLELLVFSAEPGTRAAEILSLLADQQG